MVLGMRTLDGTYSAQYVTAAYLPHDPVTTHDR